MQRWQCKVEKFPKAFLNDVKLVLLEEIEVLKDVYIDETCIRFNGKEGYGCETFVLCVNRSESCKTGRFDIAYYDKVVTAVLLLATYHLQEDFILKSNGISTIYVNAETKEVGSDFEKAISYLEEKFGYMFERELQIDEYGQSRIAFLPNVSEGKEKQVALEHVFQKLCETQEHINNQIEVLQKNIDIEGMEELLPLLKEKIEENTELFRSYLQLL